MIFAAHSVTQKCPRCGRFTHAQNNAKCARKNFSGGKARAAFTLVEILLAIALIAAMTALIAGAIGLSEEKLSQRPPKAILSTAIKRARDAARDGGKSVGMSFDNRGFFLIFEIETSKHLSRIFLDAKKNKAELERIKKAEEAQRNRDASKNFAESFFSSFSEKNADSLLYSDSAEETITEGDAKTEFIFRQIYPKLLNSVSIKFPEEPMPFLRFSTDGCMSHARITMKTGDTETEFESDIFCNTPKPLSDAQQ